MLRTYCFRALQLSQPHPTDSLPLHFNQCSCVCVCVCVVQEELGGRLSDPPPPPPPLFRVGVSSHPQVIGEIFVCVGVPMVACKD